MSKNSTPMRSESPYSRDSMMDEGEEMVKQRAEDIATLRKEQKGAAVQADESKAIKAIIRGAPTVLPPSKIPIGFVTVTSLDKSTKPVRKWKKQNREILSLGGKAWHSASWISHEPNQFPTGAEWKSTSNPTGAPSQMISQVNTTSATPNIGTSATASPAPDNEVANSPFQKKTKQANMSKPTSPTSTHLSDHDWKGNSASFAAANRGRH